MAKKKKPVGRPPLAKSEKRIARWKLSVNKTEARTIQSNAKRAGMPVAVFIRMRALAE